MKTTLSNLNEVLDVTRSLTIAQHGGDKEDEQEVNENDVLVNDQIPEVKLRKMEKIEASKVVLEKKTLKHKLRNLIEAKIGWKGNVSSGLGKGKVSIISENGDDFNLKFSES